MPKRSALAESFLLNVMMGDLVRTAAFRIDRCRVRQRSASNGNSSGPILAGRYSTKSTMSCGVGTPATNTLVSSTTSRLS
jgi:hypothetical protein